MNESDEPLVWATVPGMESFYKVSSHGQVLSLARNYTIVVKGEERIGNKPARLLKPEYRDEQPGFVYLWHPVLKHKREYIYVMMMAAFGKAKNAETDQIRFIDGDVTHCYLSNLEWVPAVKSVRKSYSKVPPISLDAAIQINELKTEGWEDDDICELLSISKEALIAVLTKRIPTTSTDTKSKPLTIPSEEGEVWKSLDDFPIYQISSHGRFKRLAYLQHRSDGRDLKMPERLMSIPRSKVCKMTVVNVTDKDGNYLKLNYNDLMALYFPQPEPTTQGELRV